jgi:hypothetical protein
MRSFLILDGVGTCDMDDVSSQGKTPEIGLPTTKYPNHPMPGDFIPATLNKQLKDVDKRVSNMPVGAQPLRST